MNNLNGKIKIEGNTKYCYYTVSTEFSSLNTACTSSILIDPVINEYYFLNENVWSNYKLSTTVEYGSILNSTFNFYFLI